MRPARTHDRAASIERRTDPAVLERGQDHAVRRDHDDGSLSVLYYDLKAGDELRAPTLAFTTLSRFSYSSARTDTAFNRRFVDYSLLWLSLPLAPDDTADRDVLATSSSRVQRHRFAAVRLAARHRGHLTGATSRRRTQIDGPHPPPLRLQGTALRAGRLREGYLQEEPR